MIPPQPVPDEEVATRQRQKVAKPPLYKVILHNDDYTTMEFVVYVLREVFLNGETEAVRIMLQVHTRGEGVAGVYTHEVAEMKVTRVTELARGQEFPLLCTMEEADA
jgi:ATP-dependent Clp protease adaptor protein ClpS